MRPPKPLALALLTLTLATLGCEKKDPPSPEVSANEATAPLADFPDMKASSWVNGAPTPLAEARGELVLLEAWHPT
ncbi:hypothetical protein [Polyangium spumosum]|uniref:Uncharacterized protein n=1 Tax=Polyangium spumosum TaxID=889282 RepID=A0A6N7Q6P0_9BACT|nr:hypothetical protein [Polyangium spumosum]MRG98580.1 hypothetical protein [Polyangium spumosum]